MSDKVYYNSYDVEYHGDDFFTEYRLVVDDTKPIIGVCVNCLVQKGDSLDRTILDYAAMTNLEDQNSKLKPRKCYCKYHLPGCAHLEYVSGTFPDLE